MTPGSAVAVGCVGDSAGGMGTMSRSSGEVIPHPFLLLLLTFLQLLHLSFHLGLVLATVVLKTHDRIDAA